LASSAQDRDLQALRRTIAADAFIDAATSSTDAQESKPAPDILVAALKALNVQASDAVYVGDAVWDIYAAGKLSIPAVGLTCGGTSEAELRDAGGRGNLRISPALLENLGTSAIGKLNTRTRGDFDVITRSRIRARPLPSGSARARSTIRPLLALQVAAALRDRGVAGNPKGLGFWVSGLSVPLALCTAGPGRGSSSPGLRPPEQYGFSAMVVCLGRNPNHEAHRILPAPSVIAPGNSGPFRRWICSREPWQARPDPDAHPVSRSGAAFLRLGDFQG